MDEIEEIKRKIDIVDLMSQYLTLRKAGANYKALCPFHQERTPSMMISSEKQIFKCFGCGEGGDIFAFVMKMESLEFVEALKMLADRAGVILKSSNKTKQQYQAEKDTKSRLYKINQLSAIVYHKILLESKAAEPAREYLKKRKLTAKTINDFLIGYTPEKPILYNFLRKRGFTDSEIKQAGSPERFHGRIIFPINDVMGNTIAFTGRTLSPEVQPKYLNTPETVMFHKSRVIYGLDKARAEIKLQKQCIIVEGQMDVVLSHQAGVFNVVASSGTALTPEHLLIIVRYTNNIAFAFDADSAGASATKKAIELAISHGLSARIIAMPEGFKDVGEIVENDKNVWLEVSKKSVPAIDWLIKLAFDKPRDDINSMSGQDKKEIAKELLPIIKLIPDEIEQGHYVKILTKKLIVSERTILEALAKVKNKNEVKASNLTQSTKKKKLDSEEKLVGLLIKYPQFLKEVMTDLDHKEFSASFSQTIYKALQSCYTMDGCDRKTCLGKKCNYHFSNIVDKNLLEKIDFLLLDIEKDLADTTLDEIKKEVLDCAERIREAKKEKVKDDFALKIQQAEEKGNREEVKNLLVELQREIGKK